MSSNDTKARARNAQRALGVKYTEALRIIQAGERIMFDEVIRLDGGERTPLKWMIENSSGDRMGAPGRE